MSVYRPCDLWRQENETKEATEVFLKYTDLAIEGQHMWNVKTSVARMTEATGTILKSRRKYLSNTTGKVNMKGLQKTATLSTANRLLQVPM
jgi:hypothetical protein